MPEALTQEDYDRFRGELLARLEPLTPELTAALEEVAARPLPRGVRSYQFRVIEDDIELGDRFPVVLDGKQAEEVLETAEPLCPPEWLARHEAVLRDEYWRELAAETIIEWFAGYWAATGGPKAGKPAEVGTQDTVRRYDLNARRWLDEE